MVKTSVVDPVSPELRTILRALKLGKLLDTLPERITLAKQQHLPNADFLELVLADEVARRETNSAALRARAAGLDPGMRVDTWDTGAGPGRGGKTHLATAPGHIAVRRRHSVHMVRVDKLFKRLKAARLDNSVEAEMRRLAHVQLLILNDFALQQLNGPPRPPTSTK